MFNNFLTGITVVVFESTSYVPPGFPFSPLIPFCPGAPFGPCLSTPGCPYGERKKQTIRKHRSFTGREVHVGKNYARQKTNQFVMCTVIQLKNIWKAFSGLSQENKLCYRRLHVGKEDASPSFTSVPNLRYLLKYSAQIYRAHGAAMEYMELPMAKIMRC